MTYDGILYSRVGEVVNHYKNLSSPVRTPEP